MNEIQAKALIREELQHAKAKHPDEHLSVEMSLGIILIELDEFVNACIRMDKNKYQGALKKMARSECAQVAACCLRTAETWLTPINLDKQEPCQNLKHAYGYVYRLRHITQGVMKNNGELELIIETCLSFLVNI